MWVLDFMLDLLDIRQAEFLQSLITLLITSHEPATSSGSSSVPNWRKPLLSIFRDDLLLMSSYSRLLERTPSSDSYRRLL
jgi:hypothetical protein